MAEPKPFASLSSGLLARKGAAVPAMRRQMMGLMGGGTHSAAAAHDIHGHDIQGQDLQGQDDLGWNDMGEDMPRPGDPLSLVGLTPMPQHNVAPALEAAAETEATPVVNVPAPPVPMVVEQRRVLAERVATPRAMPVEKIAEPDAAATTRRAKAAFTLRLDPDRHLRLRLACAVDNRSAQHIVTQALDAYLSAQPQIDALADQLPRPTGAKN